MPVCMCICPGESDCDGVLHRGLFSFQSKSRGALPSSTGYHGGSFVDLQLLAGSAGPQACTKKKKMVCWVGVFC